MQFALPQRAQLLLLVGVNERVDDIVHIAIDKRVDGVNRLSDAVIGDAPLVEIIGADALAPLARAHLCAAVAGVGRVLFLLHFFVKPRTENTHGLFPCF